MPPLVASLGAVFWGLLAGPSASAQTAPDVIFAVQVGTACGGTDQMAVLINPQSFGCSQPRNGTHYTASTDIHGTITGNSIQETITNTFSAQAGAGTTNVVSAAIPITIFARNRNAHAVSIQNQAQLAVNGSNEIASYSVKFSYSLAEWSAFIASTGTKTDPRSTTATLRGGSGTMFSQWPGVTYYSVAQITPASTVYGGANGANASSSITLSIQVRPAWLTSRAGRGIVPPQVDGSDMEWGQCPVKAVQTYVNHGSGNGGFVSTDPIATRGYPLATYIFVNSQSKFPNLLTPVGLNGAFTYSMAVRTGADGIRYLIGEDGSEFSFGPATGPPTPEPGVFAQLASTANGWSLTNAGPPSAIYRAGNFRYDFSTAGRLLKLTDPSGNVQQVSYDATGNYPTQVTDLSTGKTVRFEYGLPGLISRVVENGSAARSLSYSGNRLTGITVTDQTGLRVTDSTITYDSKGRPATVTADSNPATQVTYSYQDVDAALSVANLSWGSGATAGSTSLDYFAQPSIAGAAFRVARANGKGGVTNFDYDSSGNLLRIETPAPNGATANPVTTFTYDSTRNLKSASNGATTFSFAYNQVGSITQVSNAGASQKWTIAYQANGIDPLSIADSIGTILTLGYADPANPHSPTSFTDGNNHVWSKTYNAHGQTLTAAPPAGSPSGTTHYTYDESPSSPTLGYLKQVIGGALDTLTVDSYSAQGDATSVSTYPQSGITNTTNYQRDGAQRLTKLTHPDGTSTQISYAGRDLSRSVDEAGEATTYDVCPSCGALEGIHAPLSKTLQTPHDGDHDVSKFVDARSMITNYVYGAARELKEAIYPDGQTVARTYDNFGRLKTITDGRGQTRTFLYDSAGRVQRVQFAGGAPQPDVAFTYYADNRLHTMNDEAGITTYLYNPARLIDTVTYSFTGLAPVQVLKYAYNADNTIATLTWSSGATAVVTWAYSYDGAGRLTRVSNSFGDAATFTYDHEGKLTSQSNSNGTSLAYGYNQTRGWPTQITWSRGSTVFSSYSLTYDNGANTVGNLSHVGEANGAQTSYGYDPLYRLVSETRTGAGAYSATTGYDLANNVTTRNGSTFAAYDGANKISGLTGGSIAYDGAGNILSLTGAGIPASTFTWDTRDKLRSQTQGASSSSYKYNGFGRRVVRTLSLGINTYYIFAGDTLIGEVTATVPSVAYTWGADGLASQRLLGTSRSLFYHYGPQGEARQLTDASGNITDTYSYDAYGKLLQSTGSDPNPFRYGGKFGYYADGGSGLMLAGARWYSPNLLRWLSRDPIGYEGGDNLYTYATDRPTKYQDPSGLTPDEDRRNEVVQAVQAALNQMGQECAGLSIEPYDSDFARRTGPLGDNDPTAIDISGCYPAWTIHGTALECSIPGTPDFALKIYDDPSRESIVAVVRPTLSARHFVQAPLWLVGVPVNAWNGEAFLKEHGGVSSFSKCLCQ